MFHIFLLASLQQFVQFWADFHIYEWFRRQNVMPNPDSRVRIMTNVRRKCKHESDYLYLGVLLHPKSDNFLFM